MIKSCHPELVPPQITGIVVTDKVKSDPSQSIQTTDDIILLVTVTSQVEIL